MQPLAGDRVVVRYRLGAGGPDDWRQAPNPALTHTPSLSDLTGVLVSATRDHLDIDRDGTVERVPAAAITSIRQLSRQVVRNSQIRDVQRTLTEAEPAAERATVAGWIVSADPDSTALRANSAVPLEFGASAAALEEIGDWFARRERPAVAIIPERLVRTGDIGTDRGREFEVLVDSAGDPVEVAGDDLAARTRWRERGYGLHHTFRVVKLTG